MENIKCYELLTITFILAASSYLATGVLSELAEQNKTMHPRASQSIRDNFYVDDYLNGESNEKDFIKFQANVSKIF